MIQYLQRAAFMLAAAMLSACVTPVARDIEFNASSPRALLVVASPVNAMATTTELRRVDLEGQRFEPEIFDVVTAGIGTSHIINYNTNPGFYLSMREIDPGDYALVSLTMNTFNGYASGQQWLCARASPIFRATAGEIVLVSTFPWWQRFSAYGAVGRGPSPSAIAQEFERARARYPTIIGEAEFSEPVAIVRWPDTDPNFMQMMNRNCAEPETFSVVPEEELLTDSKE